GKGISFVRSKDLSLSVYVDSDWAKCKATRKSVIGYFVFFRKKLVSWKSKKQFMLAKSSAEAEYRAMNTVTYRRNESLRRSTRKTSMPAKLSDFEVNTKVKYNIDRQVNYSKLSIENYNFSTSLNKISEPKTHSEAAKDIRWIEAMNQEMEALNRNGTWIIVDSPIGRKPIGGKWVYKVKYRSSREVDRFKAKYVVKGYNQKEGIDYKETFSPVVKIVTVRGCLYDIA
nr:putative reverse transcriptase, RNA-dependent DNA polymerase, Gag-polypeptide of LTR copia-type [Tanacetum cinerariifolium]